LKPTYKIKTQFKKPSLSKKHPILLNNSQSTKSVENIGYLSIISKNGSQFGKDKRFPLEIDNLMDKVKATPAPGYYNKDYEQILAK